MEGAGGPRFVLQDLYTGTVYFTSDLLKNADFWKNVEWRFYHRTRREIAAPAYSAFSRWRSHQRYALDGWSPVNRCKK